jgi:hypothetical protein
LSAKPHNSGAGNHTRSNLRLGLILASVALVVFIGVIIRYWILRG